uniref:Transmembrane protein n=1 Tax=uncultured bacterium fosmid pJB65E1 TaxID=1478066 RepID=A0A0H3U7N2_9BACT|nr:hypothetical protein [uncultured bacterium fosmid pJB65E1]
MLPKIQFMMKRYSTDAVRKFLIPVIPSVFVFLYFVFAEPSHFYFQEQYQMFLFTSDYLREVLSFPGGVAVYLGRFLTQFFISAAAGALILAILFWLIHRLVHMATGREDDFSLVLSLIPSVVLALYMCDENAFLSAGIAIALGLSAACPLRSVRGGWRCAAAALVLSAVIYFVAGNLGTVVFSAATCLSCKDFRIGLASLATGLLCTYVSRYLFDYPFIRLLTGPHYHRYHDTVPLLPWVAAFSFWAISLPGDFFARVRRKVWSRMAYLVMICSMVSGLFLLRDGQKEELMTYTYLIRHEDWDGILELASKREPVDPIPLSCVNMALARKGYLGDWSFRFRQVGREGLFYPYRREHISPIPASMIYWNLGFINTCLRFTFAAEEVIPDYQKSSWCHKRLAEIFLVNGQYDLSRKYLEPLKYTLFYRSWALRTEKLLDNPDLIETHETYSAVRRRMLKEHHCTYVAEGLKAPLYYLCEEDNRNSLAYQYLLAFELLDKDLDGFAEHFDGSSFRNVPVAYQEAYVLYWSLDHPGPEGIPSFVSQKVIDRFMNFSSDYSSGNEKYLWNRYSNTYWFYYFFREQK